MLHVLLNAPAVLRNGPVKTMNAQSTTLELPLGYRTPDRWAEQVLRHPLALLSDHAYLEKKAASNALELMNRWPEPRCPKVG